MMIEAYKHLMNMVSMMIVSNCIDLMIKYIITAPFPVDLGLLKQL